MLSKNEYSSELPNKMYNEKWKFYHHCFSNTPIDLFQ